MQVQRNSNLPTSRRLTNTETTETSKTSKPAKPADTSSDDIFQIEEVASFEFKDGVTMSDLAGMLKKNDGGGFTLSVPQEVLKSSETGNAEPARPEILAKIDALAGQPIAGIKHTTRGLPMLDMHAPSAPKPFAAGRFQVDFGQANGPETGVIFETEAGPGHLASVTPGETPIEGGYVSFLSDSADSRSTGVQLNKAEEKHFLTNLYDRFSEPMTQKQADQVDSTIGYAFAVHHKEGGQGALVQSTHQEMSSALPAKGGDDSAPEQWNIR